MVPLAAAQLDYAKGTSDNASDIRVARDVAFRNRYATHHPVTADTTE